jgi:hypothetical protein
LGSVTRGRTATCLPNVSLASEKPWPSFNPAGVEALAAIRTGSASDPLSEVVFSAPVAPLQRWALEQIYERFRLETIHRSEQGFAVLSLMPREPREEAEPVKP